MQAQQRPELSDGRILVVRGDITALEVDAIVNAANPYLAGGGGVDGAIHRAGGPGIMAETRRRYPDGCPTGSAVISGAGRLRATWVIHAVGPVWQGGGRGERELLASAWRSALQLAGDAGARSVAFPSISTGVYGFPVERAAHVAVGEVRAALARGATLDVVICTFSAGDETVYRGALETSSYPPAG